LVREGREVHLAQKTLVFRVLTLCFQR
jgi:uncharacterized membrane protein